MTWQPGFDGGYPDQVFELEYKINGSQHYTTYATDIPDSGDTVTEFIESLDPDTEYCLRVRAINKRTDGDNFSDWTTNKATTKCEL